MSGTDAEWDSACERMAETLPPEKRDDAVDRMADGVAAGTPPDWRKLAIELATAAELSANNTLVLTGRCAPKERPKSMYELAVAIARGSALKAEESARRVLELAGCPAAEGTP